MAFSRECIFPEREREPREVKNSRAHIRGFLREQLERDFKDCPSI